MQNFFNSISQILQKATTQEECSDERFNLFYILRASKDEVLHSRMLGELLNPKGRHGHRESFLKLFIQQLNLGLELPNNYDQVNISLEKYIGQITDYEGGRLDIEITIGDTLIIIENKIYASDQDKQLARYHNYAKGKKHFLLYLTLYGHEPSVESISNYENTRLILGKDFYIISYKEHIINWLDKCLKVEGIDKTQRTKSNIEQYLRTLKLELGMLNDKIKDAMLEEVLKDNSNITSYLNLLKTDFRLEIYKEKIVKEVRKKIKVFPSETENSSNKNANNTTEFYIPLKNHDADSLVLAFKFDDEKNFRSFVYGLRFYEYKSETTAERTKIKEDIAKNFNPIKQTPNWPLFIETGMQLEDFFTTKGFDLVSKLLEIKNTAQ